uniref:NADH dehydrogenase [ubiquinone] 1 subunit C2 n=1 Tax=Xenopsylla cheopis TaxID=163159 RepID=A0A6M2DDY1_XENCH
MSEIEEHYAIKLLTNTFNRQPSIITQWIIPVSCGAFGFAAICGSKYFMKRPVFSGIQHHILYTCGLFAFGYVANKYRDDYYADRDAMYRHYISLHPDDFPAPERKKYGEILQRWQPIR